MTLTRVPLFSYVCPLERRGKEHAPLPRSDRPRSETLQFQTLTGAHVPAHPSCQTNSSDLNGDQSTLS